MGQMPKYDYWFSISNTDSFPPNIVVHDFQVPDAIMLSMYTKEPCTTLYVILNRNNSGTYTKKDVKAFDTETIANTVLNMMVTESVMIVCKIQHKLSANL